MFKLTKPKRMVLGVILIVLSFVLHRLNGLEYTPGIIALMLISTIVAGTPIFLNAIQAARYRIIGIDALVTIAVVGAVAIGEYWEAAAVTFLFMFGDYLESRTIEKTRSSIRALLDLAPDRARIRRDGQELEVSPDEVNQGDTVIVKPGEKISVDGTIIEGNAYINQAAITGESLPANKTVEDTVFSGTIIESGYLLIRADKVGDDTTFARILQMVEEAQDKKAQTQKFLEKFSRYYTPGIIILAILLYAITRDLVLSLTLLVIACPGALVISTPVSIVAGIGNGAQNGILIKGGDIMEKLGTVKALAFDKTGTLTIGKPVVTAVKAYGLSEQKLLKIAAIGESYSEHPLGRAIINKAIEYGVDQTIAPDDAQIITGKGLKFRYQDQQFLIGNRKLLQTEGINLCEHEQYVHLQQDKGQTVVLIADTHRVLGTISIADVVRDDTRQLISELRAVGINSLVMLTGDNKRSARAIAEQLELDGYYGELLPEDKVQLLAKLQTDYGKVAMVGDGINDAPALASADLGVAIGGAGNDAAMETADVVLMSAEIEKLAYAIGLSRATVKNMKQNIFFAIAVAGLLLAGVLVKSVNLSIGMLIHELSVLIVIINAARLLRYRSRKTQMSIS